MKNKDINLIEGPITPSVIKYAFPIILSGMLQILFNAADLAVVGTFSGTTATAAVGSTGSIISLVVNTVLGLSVGTNVLLARSLGSGDSRSAHRTVHTSIFVSGLFGIVIAVIGCLIARPALIMTKCPDTAINMAVQYLIIYFIGAPGILLYNFGSAVLRTKGDTRDPLIYLVIAGVCNVILNVIFVALFHLDAAGVALATTITQYLAAYLTLRLLTKQTDATRLELNKLRFYKHEFFGILRYGLPSGITNAMYAISNVQIQSAINSYGESAIAGNSACGNLESFVSAGISALNSTTVAFIGQNIGAGKRERIKKVFVSCMIVVIVFTTVLGFGLFFSGKFLIKNIYLPKDIAAVNYAAVRTKYLMTMYWLLGSVNVIGGATQAFGYSFITMLNSIVGICGVRTLWMQYVYPKAPSLDKIYICYPITWMIILIANTAVFIYAMGEYFRRGKIR